MDVTNDTFEEVLPRITKALKTCGFFSIDAEFTGLHLTDPRREDELDDPEQRYVRVKQSAQSFLIMQLGLSMFELDGAKGCYTSQTFNFYLFPRKSDLRFTCQASSLEFLKKHRFDFNKFIYSGIPYQTLAQQLLFQKSKQKAEEKKQQPIVLTNEADLTFVRQQIVKAHQWLCGMQKSVGDDSAVSPSAHKISANDVDNPVLSEEVRQELVLEPCNSYIRAVLHQELEKQFGKKKFYVDALQSKTKSRLLSLKLTRGSAEVVAARQAKMAAEKQREYERSVGFGHVVQLLVASKKPFVGHNMFMDICYFYQQFVGPLPSTFEEFRQKMMLLFSGGVYDTKYLAGMFPKLFPSAVGTSLEAVYCLFANIGAEGGELSSTGALNLGNTNAYAAELETASPTCMKEQGYVDSTYDGPDCLTEVRLPSVSHAKGFSRYQDACKQDNSFSHEAGYDAFMTGAIFVWLVKLFEARLSKPYSKSFSGNNQSLTDPVLQFANRLHIRRSDMPYLPLKGEYAIPDRSTLFYLFATLEDLPLPHELLSRLADMGFGVSRIIWSNPSTCYVDLKDRSHVVHFIQAVTDSKWHVKVMPFHVVQEFSKSKIIADGSSLSPKRKVFPEDSSEILKWPRWESSTQNSDNKGELHALDTGRDPAMMQLWWDSKATSES